MNYHVVSLPGCLFKKKYITIIKNSLLIFSYAGVERYIYVRDNGKLPGSTAIANGLIITNKSGQGRAGASALILYQLYGFGREAAIRH
jgi:hypothetical protein